MSDNSDQKPIPKWARECMDTIEKLCEEGKADQVSDLMWAEKRFGNLAGALYVFGVVVECITPNHRQALLEALYERAGWGKEQPHQKRIVILETDDTEIDLPRAKLMDNGLPSAEQMKGIIGGPMEFVRVLRQDLPGFVYTYMVVDEMGHMRSAELRPLNKKATRLYRANTLRQVEEGHLPSKDADSLPTIVGRVIWFDGWTCDELQAAGL